MGMEGGPMLLPGERFCPMEDELLMYYLYPKVNGMHVPGDDSLICEIDLYAEDPWKIWDRFQETRANDLRRNKDLYLFTRNTKKNSRTSRTIRTGGSWIGLQTLGQEIYLVDENAHPTSTLLGSKKPYTYKNASSVHNGRWTMYEFELDDSQLLQGNKNDYVLCLLRKPLEKKRKRQTQEEVYGDNMAPEEAQQKRQQLVPGSKIVRQENSSSSLEADEEGDSFDVSNYSQAEMFAPDDLLGTVSV